MATPLELSTRPGADGIPVVTVAGEIDMSNADRFRDALGLAADTAVNAARKLIADRLDETRAKTLIVDSIKGLGEKLN